MVVSMLGNLSMIGDGLRCLTMALFCLWLISWTMWRGIAEGFLLVGLNCSRRQILPFLTSDTRNFGLAAVLLGVACRV